MVGVTGVTAIDTRAGVVTVSTVEPTIDPRVALIELVPTPAPVARPVEELMVALAVVADAQVTELVMTAVLVSL